MAFEAGCLNWNLSCTINYSCDSEHATSLTVILLLHVELLLYNKLPQYLVAYSNDPLIKSHNFVTQKFRQVSTGNSSAPCGTGWAVW